VEETVMPGSAAPYAQEAPEVREDDDAQTRIDTLRGQARELRNMLEHEGRIQTLEYALKELRQADVDTRIETNNALRDMAKQLGALGVRKWYERLAILVLLTVCGGSLTAIAGVVVLQFLQVQR
jgi:hypothetical protein